jgi:ribosomal protein S13
MARISGVNIPDAKAGGDCADLHLRYWRSPPARKILGLPPASIPTPASRLTEAEISKLREHIDKNFRVEGDLQREVSGKTSSASKKSTPTAACATRPTCRRTDSAPRPTPAPSAARRSPWAPAVKNQQLRLRISPMAKTATRSQNVRRPPPQDQAIGCERPNARAGHIQQHDHYLYRRARQRAVLGQRRLGRLQGLAARAPRMPPRPPLSAPPRRQGLRPKPRGRSSQRRRLRPRVSHPRLTTLGIAVASIKDVTGIPHGGCRPTKGDGESNGTQSYPHRQAKPPRSSRAAPQGHQGHHQAPLQARSARPQPAAPSQPVLHPAACKSRMVKRMYGLLEKQFAKIVREAERRTGNSGDIMLTLLEQRFDNAVYRLGLAPSRQVGPPARYPRPLHAQRPPRRHSLDLLKPGDEFSVRPRALPTLISSN